MYIINQILKKGNIMGDWEDVFGVGYTTEQFIKDYLTEPIKRYSYICKGVKDRKKRFLTYEEAISWAKKNPGRNIRRSAWGYEATSIDPKYRDFYKKS